MIVLSLLAAAVLPSLITQFDREARGKETTALERLSSGFAAHVMRTRTIPGGQDVVPALANQLGWHTNAVIRSERGLTRVFLVDPAVTNTIPIPYTQGYAGVTVPIPPRLGAVFISSISRPLPSGLQNGLATTTAAFDAIWNCPEGSVPAGWTWSGKGEDLRIERVNLATLFVPLTLNYDLDSVTSTNQGRFHIDRSTTNTLPTVPTYVANYLKGTALGLHFHGLTMETLQAKEILQHPTSFTYELNTWRGALFLGPGNRDTTGLDLQAAQDEFVDAPSSATVISTNGSTGQVTTNLLSTAEVAAAITNFISNYLEWRDEGYPASGSLHDEVLEQLIDLVQNTEGIIQPNTGNNGNGNGNGSGDGGDGEGDCGGDCGEDDDNGGGGGCTNPGQGGGNHGDGSGCNGGGSGGDGHDDDDDHGNGNGNNGHGNNADGVDSSNPGQGNGGPNGADDPSGDYDDENGNGGGCSNSGHGNGNHGDGSGCNGGGSGDDDDDDHGNGNGNGNGNGKDK